ncbi:MAG: hypothetical protein Kow0032_01040 [Methyloligellaceae bacterium]
MRSLWILVPATLVLAGIIHLLAVLALPGLAPRSAWQRIAALGDANAMVVLPAASPEHQSLPLMAPDVRYAVCRFDITDGPVRLTTQILEDDWVIAFYTPDGQNFYTISGGELKRDKIEIIIATKREAIFEVGATILDDVDDVVVVATPERQGIAMIRAPLAGPSYAARTEAALQRGSCARKRTRPAGEK